MKTILRAATLALVTNSVVGHGYLTEPLPRQYREEGIIGHGWTKWMGITVPGDASFNPGEGNAPNLNAGIGGGYAGAQREQTEGHGLCGDIGSRSAFTLGPYGATAPRKTYGKGDTMDVKVKLTTYHAGWFEFRLCNPGPDGALTQACLNEHVLEIDETTPYYPDILNYENMRGISALGDGGWYKCATTGGHTDPTSNTPNEVWPHGSCCNGGGACSDPQHNKDRYVVEFAGQGGVREYDVVLKLPADAECEHCVLQWFYQTANSREAYPESFWNCADIAIDGSGVPSSPTNPTLAPTPYPSNVPETVTAAPTPATVVVTNPPVENGACGSCTGCWWTAVESSIGCYTTWSESLCSSYGDAYVWCNGSNQPSNPVTSAPTAAAPTASTVPVTSAPTAAPITSPTPAPTGTVSDNTGSGSAVGWKRVMSPELIAKGHPWGISNFGPNGLSGLDAAQAIFDDISTALEDGPAAFAAFCNSGDDDTDRREAAAFLANVLKETGGYSAFTEVSPHGTYCTWNGEGGSDLQAAGEGFPCGAPWASQGYANEFIGRGAIQLTWNINYGRFSEFYFGDRDVLLMNPELVEGDGPLGWAASLWFWMTPQDFGGQCPPKQLDSDMPLGHMSCHQAMAPGGGGMGQTIRIINGGYESCPTSSYRSSATARLEYFLGLTSLLDVAPASNTACQVNDASSCDLSGMQQYAHTEGTIGNPLIGTASSSDCPRCSVASCTPATTSKWLGVPDDPVQKLVWTCA